LSLEDEVLANAGVDVFEEVFKLIFTKLYDEHQSRLDKEILYRALKNNLGKYWYRDFSKVKDYLKKFTDDSDFRVLEFRNTGQSDAELKKKIQKRLF
jgi:type I restriction enzyme M protein